MGNGKKERQRKKLMNYLEQDEYSKLKSYISKHHINIGKFTFDRGDTLLHVACSMGQEHTLRYLLKNGAEAGRVNHAGETALHLACQYAADWPRFGYEDLVMPLLDWPDTLDVQDKTGVTPRELLEKLAESHRPQPVNTEEENENSDEKSAKSSPRDSNKNWNERLADELQDEYAEGWGNYEQDYVEEDKEPDAETFDNWASRMYKDYNRKHKQPSVPSRDEARKRRKKEKDEQKEFQRKLEEEHQEYIKKNAKKDRTKLINLKNKYEEKFGELLNNEIIEKLEYRNIPWPYTRKDGISGIKEFLLCDIDSKDKEAKKKYLKEQQIRWHPDRFSQKFNSRMTEEDKEKIMDRVKEISQAVNGLLQDDELS